MRKHVLFFVHGMGAYVGADGSADNTWSEAAAATLKQQYNKYPFVKRKAFEDRFEVHHINYDTEFNKVVQRWAAESAAMRAVAPASAAQVLKLVSWLEGGAKVDRNFAWTHASDVIFYRFFSLMRQRIKAAVALQFQRALAPNGEGAVTSWSVIAHSLGTIVTHDVLHAMDSTGSGANGISILDSMVPSASVIAMIANVTRAMETDQDVYHSLVVPQSMQQNQSACFSYLSCNNKFDPFVAAIPFNPKGLPQWDLAEVNGSFVDVKIENIHELNVHSFENYLVNPAVHIPLLERLVGVGSISKKERAAAMDAFKDVPVKKIKTAVTPLLDGLQNKELAEIAGLFFSFLEKEDE